MRTLAISDNYREMGIRIFTEENDIYWNIYRDNRLYLTDTKTADGQRFQSVKHALNDAKFNVDRILLGGYFKYKFYNFTVQI